MGSATFETGSHRPHLPRFFEDSSRSWPLSTPFMNWRDPKWLFTYIMLPAIAGWLVMEFARWLCHSHY